MTDFNLWKNDITNRFTPTSLTDAIEGSGFVATAIISGITTKSFIQYSKWDAYQDLRLKLLGGINYLPISTTIQRDALIGIVDGTVMLNKTTGREEVCNSAVWISAAGAGVMAPAAYGDMFEESETGTVMNSSTKRWVGASIRKSDENGIIIFLDDATGDRLVIGIDGAGDYEIEAKCDQTNAGGNVSTMTIQVNGINSTIADEHTSDSGDHRQLSAHGILTLADNDYLSMHVVSSTPGDVITGFHVSLTIKRLS